MQSAFRPLPFQSSSTFATFCLNNSGPLPFSSTFVSSLFKTGLGSSYPSSVISLSSVALAKEDVQTPVRLPSPKLQ